MTSEEYVVNRLQEIEEENHHLWEEHEKQKKQIDTLEKNLKYVLSIFNVRGDEGDRKIEMKTIWEKFDGGRFVFLFNLIEKLRLEKEAEAWE